MLKVSLLLLSCSRLIGDGPRFLLLEHEVILSLIPKDQFSSNLRRGESWNNIYGARASWHAALLVGKKLPYTNCFTIRLSPSLCHKLPTRWSLLFIAPRAAILDEL